MDNKTLYQRYNVLLNAQSKLQIELNTNELYLANLRIGLDKIEEEALDMENSLQALKDVKPLLAVSAIEQCERLANTALHAIFDTDATIRYSTEDERFVLDKGEFDTDLIEGNGGGYVSVVSFVFNVFLIMKRKARRLLVYDEHFTQISSLNTSYFHRFFEFLRQFCKDLNFDFVLVTQDPRIEEDMVDKFYLVNKGLTEKIK